jgi:hypothetical protein
MKENNTNEPRKTAVPAGQSAAVPCYAFNCWAVEKRCRNNNFCGVWNIYYSNTSKKRCQKRMARLKYRYPKSKYRLSKLYKKIN